MAAHKFIDYADLNPTNIKILTPEPKTFDIKDGGKQTGQQGAYNEAKIIYEFDTSKGKATDYFQLQLPPVWSFGVKQQKLKANGFSTTFILDRTTNEGKTAMNAIRKSHNQIATEMLQYKKTICRNLQVLPLPDDFTAGSQAEATGLRSILFWSTDKGGNMIDGKDPMITCELTYGTYFKRIKEIRTNPQTGKKEYVFTQVQKEQLINAGFKSIPVIHFAHVYSDKDHKCIIKCRVASAIILEIQPKGGANLQDNDDVDRIFQNNPDLAATLDNQISALENGLNSLPKVEVTDLSSSDNTMVDAIYGNMDGITPSLQQDTDKSIPSNMAQIPSQSTSNQSAQAFMNMPTFNPSQPSSTPQIIIKRQL